jgi:serine/threonine protein kinase
MTIIDVEVLRAALMKHEIMLNTHIQTRPLTECYEGALRSDGRKVFVKVLHSSLPKVRRNFRREIDVLKNLESRPFVPTIVASAIGSPISFHACMFLEGATLSSLASAHTLPFTMAIAARLAGSIFELHKMGFAHRDLSPDHVFVDTEGRHTITDFGMSKGRLSDTSERALLYKGYDIQTLGMIIWETICGDQLFPYRSSRLMETVCRELDIIHSVDLPGALTSALTACLSMKSEFNARGVALSPHFLLDIARQLEELQIQLGSCSNMAAPIEQPRVDDSRS